MCLLPCQQRQLPPTASPPKLKHKDDVGFEHSLSCFVVNISNPIHNIFKHHKHLDSTDSCKSVMEDQNIRSLYAAAEKQRLTVEGSPSSNTDIYRETLDSAIKSYEQCRQLADSLSLFSPNETIEDVSSGDLQYVTLSSTSKVQR